MFFAVVLLDISGPNFLILPSCWVLRPPAFDEFDYFLRSPKTCVAKNRAVWNCSGTGKIIIRIQRYILRCLDNVYTLRYFS